MDSGSHICFCTPLPVILHPPAQKCRAMSRRGLVPQGPERVEILFQPLQFADAGSGQTFRRRFVSGRHRLLPQHELARLLRHARRQIQFRRRTILEDGDSAVPRRSKERCCLNFLQCGDEFFVAGILANHFNPFRQKSSRSSGFGAAMTVPSGVSFTAFTPSF